MDFSKIIDDSIEKSVKEIAGGKFSTELDFDNKELHDAVQQNQLLMDFSIMLLETYHTELQKILAEQGIHI